MADEAEMRLLDRSFMDGDRYERSQARDDRANPGAPGRYDRCSLRRADGRIQPPHLCGHGIEALQPLPPAQGATRGAVCLPAALDPLFEAASVALDRPLSPDE